MLKGYRTYISILLVALVNMAREAGIEITPEIESAATVLLLGAAAYFRAKA